MKMRFIGEGTGDRADVMLLDDPLRARRSTRQTLEDHLRGCGAPGALQCCS